MSADRRRFLPRLTLSGLALGTLPSALHAGPRRRSERTARRTMVPTGARRCVRSLRSTRHSQPQFDTTWTARLTGKHKAVFDVPEIEGGSGVWRAGLWRNHYRDVLQAQPSDLSPVLVIRHAAIPLVMKQEFWEAYDIGKSRKVTHPMTDKATRRNPVLMTAEADALPPMLAASTLDRQMKQGTVVLGCNLAFGQMVSMVGKRDSSRGAEARATCARR